MADKNIQMTQRNADNTGWDNLYPITKDNNAIITDPNATEPQEPVYQKPLTEQLKETQQALAELTLLLTTMNGGM